MNTYDSDANIWVVRAGRGGVFVERFLEDGIASIGWGEVGRIGPSDTDEDILRRFNGAFTSEKPGTLRSWAGQVKRFCRNIEEGNPVATYNPETRNYHIGKVTSPVELRKEAFNDTERREFVRRLIGHANVRETHCQRLLEIPWEALRPYSVSPKRLVKN